jgi:L-ribulose-5-phosphate 4-epimerase
MEVTKITEELIIAAERAYHRGIQTGSGGNLSVRIPGKDLMLVKGSGVSFIDCTAENLIITDFSGKLVEGVGKPTREALLHGVLYKNCPQINGIVHCHSPWSIIWAQSRKALPLVTHHSKLKLAVEIPTLDIDSGVVPDSEMPGIIQLFEKEPKLAAFLLVKHGVVAVGDTVLNAEHNAELIEETAQIAVMSRFFENLKD